MEDADVCEWCDNKAAHDAEREAAEEVAAHMNTRKKLEEVTAQLVAVRAELDAARRLAPRQCPCLGTGRATVIDGGKEYDAPCPFCEGK